ncbi:MAG: hypothetical protein L0271_25765 [Gemmatimonadetes bacterium]|nr:hypothetical protein [Gemmatimonadota bacterium]
MTRHARTLAGMLVLLAMTFSLAETVWAAMCASPGDAVAAAVTGRPGPMPGHDCPPAGDQPADEESPQCPLGGFGGPQGCVAASLPGLAPVMPQSWIGVTAIVVTEPHRFVSTPSAAPFHPPRA